MTTPIFTRRNLIIVALIHYLITFIVFSWACFLMIFLNGMYVEYKIKKTIHETLEQFNSNKGNFK